MQPGRVHYMRPKLKTAAVTTTPTPSSSPPRVAALLVGINYTGTDAELQGCVRDVQNVAAFLRTKLRFPPESIVTFTDAGAGAGAGAETRHGTTRRGIMEQLTELARRSAALDFIWLHYSGHGTWRRDGVGTAGDEPDGRDECWVPSDFATAGVIPDDEIGAALRAFAPTTRIFFVSDSCYSGTVADLPYAWRVDGRSGVQKFRGSLSSSTSSSTVPKLPRIIALSGCLDTQTSADAYGLDATAPTSYSGALTTTLLRVLQEWPLARYSAFYAAARVAAALRARRFSQIPLLSASYELTAADDIYARPVQ
jgi:hypothetical protein